MILLAGPTASGKTALAVELAHRLGARADGDHPARTLPLGGKPPVGAEIISADSMQIYRGCPIGTAQPSPEELRGVPCHLVGCIEPDQPWSVADWLRAARSLIDEIHARGRAALIAGGTGLYFKAFTGGLFDAEGAGRHPELRRRLEAFWEADGGAALRRRLEEVDPDAARRIYRNDRVRTVRALEVFDVTGRPMSVWQAEGRARHRPVPAYRFVLSPPRRELYRRIDARVEEMMRKDLAEEVRELARRGAREDWPAMRALGYATMLRLLRGELTRDQAVEETQRLSRRYAKQQLVLLRKWPGAVWLDGGADIAKIAADVEILLEFPPPTGF